MVIKKNEEQVRQKAIELYENNWPVSKIIRTLKRSKSWFYKWLNRYQSGDKSWYKEHLKVPKNSVRKLSADAEELIIQTRKELEQKPYRQYGP